MAIYEFNYTPPNTLTPKADVYKGSQKQAVPQDLARQPDTTSKRTHVVEEQKNLAPEEVVERTVKGLHTLDKGMKEWLGDIRVPYKSGYKFAAAHIVSHDRALLSWAQEFFDGRVPLPIVAIQRNNWKLDWEMYSPPYLPYQRTYTDDSRKRMRLIYRPLPFKVDMTVSIWAEFKQDAEYISMDIIKRCTPLGEFEVEDEHMQQYVRVVNQGVTNSGEVDIAADDRPKVLYEVSLEVDFAVPVNERIVPTILGKVMTIKERDTGEIFEAYRMDDIT